MDRQPCRPARAAERSREDDRRARLLGRRAVPIRREGSRVLQTAAAIAQRATKRRVLRRRIGSRDEIVGCIADPRDRRRLQRHGLRGRHALAGHVRRRCRRLAELEHRLTGSAIEHVEVAGATGECEHRHALTIDRHLEQHGRREQIVVPHIVTMGSESANAGRRCAHRARRRRSHMDRRQHARRRRKRPAPAPRTRRRRAPDRGRRSPRKPGAATSPRP